jgi:hypothetical protein
MGAPAPNFLSNSRALLNCLRLSLEKAAHAALSHAAKQEIRSVRGALSSTFPQRGEHRCIEPNCLAAFVHYNLLVLDFRLGCWRCRRSRRGGAGYYRRSRGRRWRGYRGWRGSDGLDWGGDVRAVWSWCHRCSGSRRRSLCDRCLWNRCNGNCCGWSRNRGNHGRWSRN